MPYRVRSLAITARLLTLGVCIAGAATALGWWKKGELPDPTAVLPEVRESPLQRPTDEPPYVFAYHNTAYTVEPVADYEISGLVVSHNDIFQWGDIYHDATSVDVRDLCVVYGPTAASGAYREPEFWSEPWTCWYRFRNTPSGEFFDEDLSNNHLLSQSEEVRQRIWSTRVGDQVRIRGRLVNYYRTGFPEESRRSSLVRTDTGNGACEVVMVDRFEILSRGGSTWYLLYEQGLFWLKLLLVLKVVTFCLFPYLEVRHNPVTPSTQNKR
jgi:hypothetical protein